MWAGHHAFAPFCFIPFIIFVLLLIAFIVSRIFWFRRFGGCCSRQNGRMDAEAILRRRLANGDITEEEYQKTKDILSK
jgi:uncharacterized membrane protein